MIEQKEIDEIIEFVVENGGEHYSKLPAEDFISAIKGHDKYGTIEIVRDDKGIAAIARWNWIADNEVKVLDCIVRKDMRSSRMIKYLVKLGSDNNKNIKFIRYDRYFKYPYRETRRIKIGG